MATDEAIRLDIVTPAGILLSEQVSAVQVPGALGLMGILHNHAPLMTTLEIGAVKFNQGGKDHFLAVSGGFVEVKDNVVIILADAAERAEDIDLARAKASEKRAKERLEQKVDIDMTRAEAALKRALNREKVATLK